VPNLSPEERRLRAQIAAHESWARTADRTGRTAAARRKFLESFEEKVDPLGILDPKERARRAEHARKAHFARLALKSAAARKARARNQRSS